MRKKRRKNIKRIKIKGSIKSVIKNYQEPSQGLDLNQDHIAHVKKRKRKQKRKIRKKSDINLDPGQGPEPSIEIETMETTKKRIMKEIIVDPDLDRELHKRIGARIAKKR